MRSLKIFFLILILTASGILLAAADYGESSTSLGQITDEFDTLDNVSVAVEVIRNATLDAMELNETTGPSYYDFTGFGETDPNNRLSQTNDVSTWNGLKRGDGNTQLVGDLGVDNFKDSFSLYFELNLTDAEAGDASWRTYCIGFTVHNHASDYDNGRRIMLYLNQRQADPANDDTYEIWFYLRTTGGATDTDTSIALNVGTNYFMNLTRHNSGDSVRLTIKTGSHEGAVHDTLDNSIGTFGGEFLRYIYTPALKTNPNDANDWSSGTVSRLSDSVGGVGFVNEGYFSTTDYLSSINGSGLVHLVNTTIPGGTGITVEYSVDNSTWILNDWDPLFGGFEAVDLRNLNYSAGFWSRFNMSGTPVLTPRLYQSRLVTTEGSVGPGAPGQNVSSEWVTYNLTEIGVTVGTLDAGNLASTLDIDGDMFNVSEVVGAPGMLISGNFSGVDPDADCLWVVIYAHYDGNLNHDFDIEVWNFTSSAWVEDSHIIDGTELEWFNSTIYALRIPNEFLSGGEVRVRLDHEAPGNINHDLFVEYFKLVAEIPAGPTLGAGAVTVTIVESDFPWIAIAIILMCVAFLLFWNWKR